jgi:hypothetical protein
MTELGYFLTTGEDSSRRLTAFDYATKLLLPTFIGIATVIGSFRGMPADVWWGLVVLIALSLVLGFSGSLTSAVRTTVDRIKDRQAACRYLPGLQRLVLQFGDFVDGRRSDTLHYYIADSLLCEGHGERMTRLGMPNMALWSGRWDLFSRRLGRQRPNVEELQYAVLEFHDLVGTYINFCASVVFDRLPQDLMTAMTPRAKSNLNAFQQRFERFHSESEQLLKEICESRPSLERLPRNFAPLKPLP